MHTIQQALNLMISPVNSFKSPNINGNVPPAHVNNQHPLYDS